MHEIERHGDVVRVRLWSRVSAAAGYDVSVYLTRGLLIDTGFPHVAPEIARLLGEWAPRGALVTHWHEDHAGNVPMLAARGVPLAMAPATLERLRERPPIRLYRHVTWGQTPPLSSAPAPLVHDGLELLPTPGHSADHHVVWDRERGTLFGGDLFLGVKVRIAHPGEDPRALVASLRRAAALRPERLFDAHRGLVPDAAAALAAKAEWHAELIGQVDAKIDAGWSDRAIRRALLGGESLPGWLSGGDYARINFVRAVRRTR